MARLTSFVGRLICGVVTWAVLDMAAPARGQPRSTAEVLVDLARDHGLNQRGKQQPTDVAQIRTWLRAALRLDPTQTEAYIWLYELAALAGDQAGAAETLGKLTAIDPTHEGAFARWVEAHLANLQTIETRTVWLQSLLDAGTWSPEQRALVHCHLAGLAWQRMERAAARDHLRHALDLNPAEPLAARLALELLDGDAPRATRLRAAWRALRANPLQVELAWQIGVLLDDAGFHDDAGSFYEHALSVHQAANPGTRVPAVHLLSLSQNLLARGQTDATLRYARQAVETDPASVEARLYHVWLLLHLGRASDAQAAGEQLARRFAEIREPSAWPVEQVAQAAWFYCFFAQRPQRALALAEAAAARAPGDVFVTRTLGWAQAVNERSEDAQKTLAPIAGQDPYATYMLARLLRDAGDDAAPARLVHDLKHVPNVGPAFKLLKELGVADAASQPATQEHQKIADGLADFDRECLAFAQDPGRFLKAEVALQDPSPEPGEPWRAAFTLTNQGRFPITFGPDWMVNPVFLLSFELEGDRERKYPHLLTVSLDRARAILPGQTVRLTETIDIGPVARISRLTPQQLQRITLTAILDPQQRPDGGWEPSMSGQTLRPVFFNRLPADTGPAALHALLRAVSGTSETDRFHAIEILAELLGERQRADRRPLGYEPAAVPAERIRQALLGALSSESWELRARTLSALQVVGLDAEMVRAAERCLEHAHWLVRLMAIRLLARQGPGFAEQAQRIAAEDEDELVRDLAASYFLSWRGPEPTPQPSVPSAE